jgi:UDP-galactopyranose mutase
MNILILGGGLSGCTLAYLLKKKNENDHITIIEQDDGIGGLCRTKSKDGINYELGPHILFTHREDLKKFFKKFIDSKEKNFYQYVSIDGRLDNLRHFPVTIDDVIDIDRNAAKELYHLELSKPDYSSLESFLLSQVGRTAYEYFFKNYNIKQWGIHPRKMETDWAKQRRMFLRDTVSTVFGERWQGHPGSYSNLFESLTKDIKIINEQVTGIDFENQCVFTDKETHKYDFVFNTTPIDYLIHRKSLLKYRGIFWVYVLLGSDYVLPTYLTSFPNNHNFTRIMEYKHASQQTVSGKTIIGFEFPYESSDQSEPSSKSFIAESLDFVKQYFPDKYISHFIDDRRLAYPVSEKDNNEVFWGIIHESLFKNFITLGRLGLYSYISMDTCVDQCRQAIDVFDKWNTLFDDEKITFYKNLRAQQT